MSALCRSLSILILPALLLISSVPIGSQVTISLIFTVPGNGTLPNTQSFIPAGVPQLGPTTAAIVFRRPDPPPSQACRFNATANNPQVATIDPLQLFLSPDDGIGGTGATWQAIFFVTAKNPGQATFSITWDDVACGIQARAAGQARNASVSQLFTVNVLPSILEQGSGKTKTENQQGDPVGTFTGALSDSPRDPDLDLGGPFPLQFSRYYSTRLGSSLPGAGGGQGLNWMHNFDVRAEVQASTAKVTLFGGQQVSFQLENGSWTRTSADAVNYQFSGSGINHRFADPSNGRIYSFTNGRLTEIQDANGNKHTITRAGGSSGPDQVSDGLGRLLKFTYAFGKLQKVEDQTGRSVSFGYQGDNLTSFTNAGGKVFQYTYDGSKLATTKLPTGNTPLTQQYDAQNRVTRQTDSRGNATVFSYGPAAGSTTIVDPGNATFLDQHDADGNFLQRTDPFGKSTVYTYDASRRVTKITDRRGGVTSTTYDAASGFPATITNALGQTTKFSYTPQVRDGFTFYNRTKVEYADGTSETFGYDAKGNITSATDRAGKTTTRTYNTRGQILTETNPAGGVTTYAYSGDGTLASLTLPSGDQTTFQYDAQQRPIRVNLPGGASRQITYDTMNRVLTTTDERGNVRTATYNDNGRIQSSANALNQAVQYAYDGDERIASVTDALNRVSTFAYDPVGRLRTTVDPDGASNGYTRDPLGRITSVSRNGGKVMDLAYDPEGAVTSVTDALGQQVKFDNDALGRPTKITDAAGHSNGIAYDSQGRVISSTNGAAETTQWTYDPRGLTSSIQLAGNAKASFSYDNLGLPVSVQDPNLNSWASGYDTSGRLISRTDPLNRTTTFSYDNRQRVSRVAFPQGSADLTYDATGNLTRALYSDGTNLQYTYDAANRLTGANNLTLGYDANGRVINSNGITLTRDPAGRIASITYAAGRTVTYEYNADGLVTKIRDWIGGATEYTYDAARRVSATKRPNGVISQITYGADGNMSKVAWSGGSVNALMEWQRDGAGRVTSQTQTMPDVLDFTATTTEFTYDAAHQRNGTTYDALGRIVIDGDRTYQWDLASRLTGFIDAANNTNYQYDGLGQLVSAANNYVWLYAFDSPMIAIERAGNTDLRYYIFTPSGQLMESIEASGGARHYYHVDQRGTVLFLTGDSGAVTDSYAISPYGERITHTGNTPNPFTFLGAHGVMQMGSGLFYMRARFYNAFSARFLSRDPLPQTDPRAINPYQYAAGNPILYVDPSGLSPVEAGGQGILRASDLTGSNFQIIQAPRQARRSQFGDVNFPLQGLTLADLDRLAPVIADLGDQYISPENFENALVASFLINALSSGMTVPDPEAPSQQIRPPSPAPVPLSPVYRFAANTPNPSPQPSVLTYADHKIVPA